MSCPFSLPMEMRQLHLLQEEQHLLQRMLIRLELLQRLLLPYHCFVCI